MLSDLSKATYRVGESFTSPLLKGPKSSFAMFIWKKKNLSEAHLAVRNQRNQRSRYPSKHARVTPQRLEAVGRALVWWRRRRSQGQPDSPQASKTVPKSKRIPAMLHSLSAYSAPTALQSGKLVRVSTVPPWDVLVAQGPSRVGLARAERKGR